MKKGKYMIVTLIFLAAASILFGLQRRGRMQEKGRPYGLFSWQEDVLLEKNRGELFEVMEYYGFNELYQNIPEASDRKVLQDFLEEAARRKISVFLLTGDPRWGLDQTGKKACHEVQRTALLNECLEGEAGLAGVMLDVEPYLTEEWKEAPGWVMKRYVSGMKTAFSQAEKVHLKSMICIPYYYDTQGFTEELEELIGEGCHGAAVMNYYKGKEKEHIQTELSLAKASNKPLMTIYELQPPGEQGVEECNTYYEEGMEGVLKSFKELSKAEKDCSLSYGIHNYKVLREVRSRE